MAITLSAGEVANDCDDDAQFGTGSNNGDIFIQGSDSVGLKVSQTTNTFDATTLGAAAPYDFSATGTEAGWHIILWFDGLMPLNATTGMRIYVEDSTTTDNGYWAFAPPAGYSGGWVARVIDPSANFTAIGGTWSTTGNPAQLTAVAAIGGGFTTTTMVSGNFQNCIIDQITVGTGLRADAGSVTTPNTWETIRAADEGSAVYGWVASAAGGFVVKGGIFLGPASGNATSVFNDTAAVVLFADENVAAGFYQINIRGTATNVDLIQNIIRAEDPSGNANSRWNLIVNGTDEPAFDDNDSLFAGSGTITLQTSSNLTGTTLDDGNSLIQNGADLDGITVQNANTGDGVAYITCDDIEAITNCDFNFSDGHALELTSDHAASPTELTFAGNTFTGSYGGTPGDNPTASSGSNDAMIYNNSGKDLIINITGGGTEPSVRNGASATTVINANVNVTVTILDTNGNALPGVEVSMFETDGTQVFASISTDENGEVASSAAISLGDVVIRARQNTNIASFDTTTGVNDGTDVITTDVNHHFQDGDAVVYDKDGGSEAIGLTDATTYFAHLVSSATLSLHATAALAIADTSREVLTGTGSETHLLNPIRYVNASATGTIGVTDFATAITMITDTIGTG